MSEMTSGERVKFWRERKRLSQKELADRLGWVQSQVSRAERGETPMTTQDLEQIVSALGMTMSNFYRRVRAA